MSTRTGKSILISRRAFATSLLASAALGLCIGELASPLASSQAHPAAVAAKAPAACAQFAIDVGHAFTVLGTILNDAADYPPLISQDASAGLAKNTTKINAIAAQVRKINAEVSSEGTKFAALKGPISQQETQCLG
jgi:hypothetical protein